MTRTEPTAGANHRNPEELRQLQPTAKIILRCEHVLPCKRLAVIRIGKWVAIGIPGRAGLVTGFLRVAAVDHENSGGPIREDHPNPDLHLASKYLSHREYRGSSNSDELTRRCAPRTRLTQTPGRDCEANLEPVTGSHHNIAGVPVGEQTRRVAEVPRPELDVKFQTAAIGPPNCCNSAEGLAVFGLNELFFNL